jgi:Domain of unknown function (DUF4749)
VLHCETQLYNYFFQRANIEFLLHDLNTIINMRRWDYECFDGVHCLQVLHKQFNSPIGLYSEQNIADSVQSQAGAGVTP